MRRCDLGDVLRAGTKGSAKTQDETTKHEQLDIWREALNKSCDNSEETTDKVDASSTDLIRETKERCTAEVTNGHESIDNTECRATVFEAKVFMPVNVGVDTADNTPVDTVAAHLSSQFAVTKGSITNSRGLICAHDHHVQEDTESSFRPQVQSLPRFGDQVIICDSSGDNLFDGDARLLRISLDILIDVVTLERVSSRLDRHTGVSALVVD